MKKVKSLTDENLYHEHVTNYIYAHPETFKISWIEGPEVIKTHPDIRLTIDTEADFKSAQTIYAALCEANPFPTISEVVTYLDAHKSYYESMKQQIEKNSK